MCGGLCPLGDCIAWQRPPLRDLPDHYIALLGLQRATEAAAKRSLVDLGTCLVGRGLADRGLMNAERQPIGAAGPCWL